MASWSVILDPAAAITNRAELNLNSGALAVVQTGIDWGDAAVAQYLSQQLYGEAPVSYRVPNRVVTIPMVVGAEAEGTLAQEEKARRHLQQKVSLLQREGGVLLRQREGGEPLYADIVDAVLTLPDVWGETGAVEPSVVLKITCLPDFYGEEIELEAAEGTGQVISVLNKGGIPAIIPGDYPARTRIVLTEKSSNNQEGLLWGLRATHYDSAATAALVYDAKELTPLNGAVEEAHAGTYSGKWVKLAKPEANTWHPFLSTDLSGTQLTHLGSYRVWVRAMAGQVGMMLRLAWSLDDATAPVYNEAVNMAQENWEQFRLFDLGEIRIQEPPTGEHWWRGILQANCGGQYSAFVAVDRIWLQPVDDGAGKLRATATPSSTLFSPKKEGEEAENNATIGAGKAWTKPEAVEKGRPTQYASVEVVPSEKSQALLVKKLGFTLPGEVKIKGISVGIVGYVSSPYALLSLKLVKGTTVLASKEVTYTNGNASETYGSSSDLWGRVAEWKPAEVNETGFGVAIVVADPDPGKNEMANFYDVIVTVYCSYSSAAIVEDAVLYSARKTEIRFDGGYREDTTSGAYVAVSALSGDLPRLPPSGLENRSVQLFVKNSRGNLGSGEELDSGRDGIQAQVFYRPCFIGRL